MRYAVNVYREHRWQWQGEAASPEEAQAKALAAAEDVADDQWEWAGLDMETTEPFEPDLPRADLQRAPL